MKPKSVDKAKTEALTNPYFAGLVNASGFIGRYVVAII